MCDGFGKVDMKDVKLEHGVDCGAQGGKWEKVQLHENKKSLKSRRQGSEENRSSNALSTGQSGSSVLEQGQSPVDDNGVSSTSTICAAPLCRQFWKAGNYEDGLSSKASVQTGKNYLHVHPMFLHSNATSHKWAFGAIAELLDNAVDEIQNGATFVNVDKTSNPRDGSPALLIHDDGGGMDPEAIRRCMSFGFSDKKSTSAIGQYGNGFKTSTMRLGADVIVFSRHLAESVLTQSIGLLSYTFLTRAGYDRIVVPMVDYEFNITTGKFEVLHRFGKEHFASNLSMLLQWSPYSTDSDLLQQFDDIGPHGTKVIVYNLWFSDNENAELDFDTDPEDIRISGDIKKVEALPAYRKLNEDHIANRLKYSLRAYLSILYLRIPATFCIVLRGKAVEHHNLANDLKFQEFILYKPQTGGCREAQVQVITTIGFLKEAPKISAHGFNVYHKNRLILPFWQVVNYADSRGRGVAGVLEANFVEPTHSKQDFERTSLLQKLEVRLKEMTWEYWDYHCGLIGYQVKKRIRTTEPQKDSFLGTSHGSKTKPVNLHQSSSAVGSSTPASTAGRPSILEVGKDSFLGTSHGSKTKPVNLHQSSSAVGSSIPASTAGRPSILEVGNWNWGLRRKRKELSDLAKVGRAKWQPAEGVRAVVSAQSLDTQPVIPSASQFTDQESEDLVQENVKLRAKCLEYETRREEVDIKVTQLRSELVEVQKEYEQLMAELTLLDEVKDENVHK